MKKRIYYFVVLMVLTSVQLFADDIEYLTSKIYEVGKDLNLSLQISSTYRSWEQQINEMQGKDYDTLLNWYGQSTADAFIEYQEGKRSKDSLVANMKKNNLIKHPNGLAVDIGINKSRLSDVDADRVIEALRNKGLYVKDERPQGNSCIHVSRSKY